jgi:hypothetical protein
MVPGFVTVSGLAVSAFNARRLAANFARKIDRD